MIKCKYLIEDANARETRNATSARNAVPRRTHANATKALGEAALKCPNLGLTLAKFLLPSKVVIIRTLTALVLGIATLVKKYFMKGAGALTPPILRNSANQVSEY